MSASAGSVGAGLLLIIAGLWVLLQTVAGNLASRLIGLGGGGSPTSGSIISQALNLATNPAAQVSAAGASASAMAGAAGQVANGILGSGVLP